MSEKSEAPVANPASPVAVKEHVDPSNFAKAQAVLLNRASKLKHFEDVVELDIVSFEAAVKAVVESKADFPAARAAAFLWLRGRRATFAEMLQSFTLTDVLAVVKLLDCNRKIRQLNKKLGLVKKKKKKNALTKNLKRISDDAITIKGSSATGAFMKYIKRWVREIPADKLEFFLVNFPREPWQELADLAHLSPKDFSLEYFLPVIFGGEPPEGTLVHSISSLKTENDLVKLIMDTNMSTFYSFIRTNVDPDLFKDKAKLALAKTAPLADLIWWYEEISAKGVDSVIRERLLNGEPIEDITGRNRNSFGKIMERLLFFRSKNVSFLVPLQVRAEKMLKEIKIPTTKTAVVLGDASASMQVAINSATIIGSVVCSCLDGSLRFFNDADFLPDKQPRSVRDILDITTQVRAGRSTAPVASLLPYYLSKKPVDLFIVVTDEEENCLGSGSYTTSFKKHNSYDLTDLPPPKSCRFSELFLRYIKEVYAQARVIFVSFLRKTTTEGQMMEEMKLLGLEERCVQFRFDPTLPDLSKLSNLLGVLALEANPNHLNEAGKFNPDDLNDVPIFCSDGTITVSKAQAAAIERAFVDVDTMSMEMIRRALPKLRLPTDSQNDAADANVNDAASVTSKLSGWTFCS